MREIVVDLIFKCLYPSSDNRKPLKPTKAQLLNSQIPKNIPSEGLSGGSKNID